MNEQDQHEIGDLFESMVDRSLTAESRSRLMELLQDEDARREYIQYCQTHAMLAWEHGSLEEVIFPEFIDSRKGSESTTEIQRSLRRWRWLALSVSATFLVAATWYVLRGQTEKTANSGEPTSVVVIDQGSQELLDWRIRPLVASVTASRDSELTESRLGHAVAPEGEVRTGRYALQSGFVTLTFTNGIEIVAESPAEFELKSAMKMIVHKGRISAKVSERGQGFVVETPSARLVDYGTEFSVDVASDSSSEVHVFSGEVTVRPKDAPANAEDLRLTANQATVIHAGCGIPEGIDIDHGRFVRNLGEFSDRHIEYHELVESLEPLNWFRMSFATDGVTLLDDGSRRSDATVYIGEMKPEPFKPGRVGTSLYLGGPATGAHARVADYEPVQNNRLTISAWVQAKSRPRWAAIAKHWSIEFTGKRSYSGPGGQFHFGLHEDDGGLELQVRAKDGEVVSLREREPIPLRTWQHVAFVVDGQSVRLYRNAKLVDSAACRGLATDGPPAMGIGIKLNAAGTGPNETNPGYWHGRIDELLRFDRALTDAELLELFQATGRGHGELAERG